MNNKDKLTIAGGVAFSGAFVWYTYYKLSGKFRKTNNDKPNDVCIGSTGANTDKNSIHIGSNVRFSEEDKKNTVFQISNVRIIDNEKEETENCDKPKEEPVQEPKSELYWRVIDNEKEETENCDKPKEEADDNEDSEDDPITLMAI